ncbi:MAG: S41 family peptidase [Bacteroidales bacterium]|nr:S41 family peptidase [Bacteroidales bacterium]
MKENKKRYYIYLPLAFAVVLIAGIMLGTRLVQISSNKENILSFRPNQYNKVTDIINYVENNYVDSVSKNKLNKNAIEGMLDDLDPHSSYITANEFDDVNDPLRGNFEGIGIQFRIENDSITVISPIQGGPSEKVGIQAGDRIVKINGKEFTGPDITNEEIISKLKGERGTEVNVSVYRRGVEELLEFSIVRDVIPTYSINVAYMVTDSIGYIKLSKFSATSHEEFLKAYKDLHEKGLEKLILDLRGNTGGYLKAAIDLADEFLKQNELIVYTEGHNRPKKDFYATTKGHYESKRLVILIDEGSASASEIIAGAVQDNDRGLIVGRRSFGKGLVQEQLTLMDGSAIRLTVARYHTPTGRSIQKPYDEGREEYFNDFYHRITNGELENPDSIQFADSLKYTTPAGKTVYGGGGIMPDVYVALESDPKYKYFNQLVNKGLIYKFAFAYTDKHREQLNRIDTVTGFIEKFRVSDQLFTQFVDFAKDKGVKPDQKGIDESKAKIKNLIKAFIARNIYDDKGFYPIYLETDKTFNKAMDILEKSFSSNIALATYKSSIKE